MKSMGTSEPEKSIFPLTSLQIGDLQSYLSHLSLFMVPESKHFYILVDNRPWLRDLVSRPAQFWQLMVTKSRLSPFANSRVRERRKGSEDQSECNSSSQPNTYEAKKFAKWFSLVDAATLSRKRALLPVKKLRNSLILNSELHMILYGFIVFEVACADVRGINYVNELQTDTSLAIESKLMKRWEFDSIAHAANCISSWFSGTSNEQLLLKDYLDAAVGDVFYEAEEGFPNTEPVEEEEITADDENNSDDDVSSEESSSVNSDNEFSVYPSNLERKSKIHSPPSPTGPNKRRKISNSGSGRFDFDISTDAKESEKFESPKHSETSVEAMEYRDVLILVRFNDRDLPFRLREIIMSDLRLLTLLEAGLPSWVIFLQSYPGFCHLYRSWMCPLVRALYVMVSIITVLIGFYDLYKNVPLLKATASRLFGPLVDWIETWEMVSRIKYLGTMLFLHNFEKAVKWLLMFTRTIRSFLSVLAQPLAGPLVELMTLLLPIWNVCFEVVEGFTSVIWIVIESSCSVVGDLVEIVVLPIWFILFFIWRIVYSILYPIFWILWELLYAPIRMVLVLSSFVALICTCIYDFLEELWLFMSGMLQLASASEAVVATAHEVPIWRSLWNDLFSQIFKAVRSILNGLVAFFAACNRHRLSIYNHVQKLVRKPLRRPQINDSSNLRHNERSGGTKITPDTRRKIHFS